MSGIVSRGRRGSTAVPNWRWEDPDLDPYELRIAGWLASHTDTWRADNVTRNTISARTNVSAGKVSLAMKRLAELGIVEVSTVPAHGGERWTVVFDHEKWEGGWSPHDHRVVTTRPLSGHDMTATRGLQREEQEEPPLPPASGGLDALADDFDEFWQAYPRKVSKPHALRAYVKARNGYTDRVKGAAVKYRPASREEVLDGLINWIPEFNDRPSDKVPHAATWLNARNWETPPPESPNRPRTIAEKNADVLRRMREMEL